MSSLFPQVFNPFFIYPFWEDPKDKGWLQFLIKTGISWLRDKIGHKRKKEE